MKQPILNKLENLNQEQAISLHVPGHKNMTIGHLSQLSITMDKTEIPGLDDMHHPEEIILESMKQVEKHSDYDAYFLVNGTTSGILSVIQSFSQKKGDILMARNVHKSVLHALDISQQEGHFIETHQSLLTNHYNKVNLSSLNNDGHKLAVLTYPNYYGETFNVEEVIKFLHQLDIPVLIDEAHGAHFGLQGFPNSTLNYQADYVVQSFHKTLPALTMGSVLYIHKNALYRENIIEYLSYFQTSSPSYLIMASLESAAQFYKTYDSTVFFEKRAQLIKCLENKGFEIIQVDDPLKLLLKYEGYTGHEIQKWFMNNHIYFELADGYQSLAILPLWHEGDAFLFDLLLRKIEDMVLPEKKFSKVKQTELLTNEGNYKPNHFEHVTWCELQHAHGKVVARHIVPYPPGVPIIFKGETITESMIKLMNEYLETGVIVEGINNNKILVEDE
ncbi:TPA: aminotransferase class V-fold PLP-dependent enzyme [Staphylococcus argenteus]|uniref:aminotransferase class V-fold PLP-dependent enzyme n=1 Tax=Staphylococcus argenteus TaxID=985002 RepID=UPI000234015C|nr:aminotransferase class V-fold PLP-dependent enzyme [Staphylococcus argenteus]MBE2132495.1 aminotransferase class V-fold PLP-dependent enzyme [Staphylococcus argenteus]PNY91533.1 aminotransferase class V-fold PLP-dependent enzyme [Staphylococcus argenteus]CCE58281.1 Orn/Lys/Arg decarboxylase family protein [Staphylococcus argenteus]SUJ03782.1 Orn/Lys/Arg decarboxylase family protein [Staphylococcus argenteus]HDY9430460.1 aminotransferase class V-fold PLP-dependent enzyme [Staphylococcus arge